MDIDLVFSDIHADLNALKTILDVNNNLKFIKKFGSFNRVINLGDILGRGLYPKEVISLLNSLKTNYDFISLIGNHDEAFLYNRIITHYPKESIDAHSLLNPNNLQMFEKKDEYTYADYEFIDKEKRVVYVHGGPLDPKKITPTDANENAWRYNKSWQRISEENFEFFSLAGYHYLPSSAFDEIKTKLNNFLIICGHQHSETAYCENDNNIENILHLLNNYNETIDDYILSIKELQIESNKNYLIRIGLGGPAGDHMNEIKHPHFCLINHEQKNVKLFEIIQKT